MVRPVVPRSAGRLDGREPSLAGPEVESHLSPFRTCDPTQRPAMGSYVAPWVSSRRHRAQGRMQRAWGREAPRREAHPRPAPHTVANEPARHDREAPPGGVTTFRPSALLVAGLRHVMDSFTGSGPGPRAGCGPWWPRPVTRRQGLAVPGCRAAATWPRWTRSARRASLRSRCAGMTVRMTSSNQRGKLRVR